MRSVCGPTGEQGDRPLLEEFGEAYVACVRPSRSARRATARREEVATCRPSRRRASSPAGNRVATDTTWWPRANATQCSAAGPMALDAVRRSRPSRSWMGADGVPAGQSARRGTFSASGPSPPASQPRRDAKSTGRRLSGSTSERSTASQPLVDVRNPGHRQLDELCGQCVGAGVRRQPSDQGLDGRHDEWVGHRGLEPAEDGRLVVSVDRPATRSPAWPRAAPSSRRCSAGRRRSATLPTGSARRGRLTCGDGRHPSAA